MPDRNSVIDNLKHALHFKDEFNRCKIYIGIIEDAIALLELDERLDDDLK